jgi:hypothetical protein
MLSLIRVKSIVVRSVDDMNGNIRNIQAYYGNLHSFARKQSNLIRRRAWKKLPDSQLMDESLGNRASIAEVMYGSPPRFPEEVIWV